MTDQDLKNISVTLYQYMCQHIVGSEETVKTKRLMIALDDNMASNKKMLTITSGSAGEGLEMKGSDVDVMLVRKDIQVHENISKINLNPFGTNFIVVTDDTKLGFVKLLLLHSYNNNYVNLCVEHEGGLYLSNQRMKSYLKSLFGTSKDSNFMTEINHGPCLSDKIGLFDFAICVHLESWIKQAESWICRQNSVWPSNGFKSNIIKHGVLFVPIGVKGSPNEEIEWRISFSLGEKFLINSFTHTQLLCYALMKITLKDIIDKDENCKDLLCSYFIKNIMFWVSEELPISIWKQQNLLSCFMQCFKRLIYCVTYSLCPHYFIPGNNMFENKIEGRGQNLLLDRLNALYDLNWHFILFSQQLNEFYVIPCIRYTESQWFINHFEQMHLSRLWCYPDPTSTNMYNKSVKVCSSYISPRTKSYKQHYLSISNLNRGGKVNLNERDNNRHIYKKYKLCQSYLLQGIHHDAVSGWLHVASLFYRIKQYRNALWLLHYALSKCSQEKIIGKTKLSRDQREILGSKSLQKRGVINVFKFLCLDYVTFVIDSTFIPRELELEIHYSTCIIPPVAFAHFLSFLCHFHLRDARHTRKSLEYLQRTISEEYFSRNPNPSSVNCLGIALQLVGDNDLARQAFQHATDLDPTGLFSCALRRLYMMNAG